MLKAAIFTLLAITVFALANFGAITLYRHATIDPCEMVPAQCDEWLEPMPLRPGSRDTVRACVGWRYEPRDRVACARIWRGYQP